MAVLEQRSQAIHTVSAQGLVTLTRDNGDTVRMEAVMVLQRPDFARLRAWVFGQAVFDMTLTPDGLWVVAPKDEGNTGGERPGQCERRERAVRRRLQGGGLHPPMASTDGRRLRGAERAGRGEG